MKKLLTFALAIVMSIGLCLGVAACDDKTGGGSGSLKVWGSQESQAMLKEIADKYNTITGKNIKFEFGVVGEGDAKQQVSTDVKAAADVFHFASDQLAELNDMGALQQITRNKDAIVAANDDGSIEAATVDGKLMAYPISASNGYFLYYNKAALTADDVKSVDGILAKAAAQDKKFVYNYTEAFYTASFFFTTGCRVSNAGGTVTCDFNSAEGVKAGKAMATLAGSPQIMVGGDDVIKNGFSDGSVIAAVSGTWNIKDIKEILGANYGVCKMPTIKIDGAQKQLSGFVGYKYVGVNKYSKNTVEAMDFAEYLTNADNQILRFTRVGDGPSNKEANNSDIIKNDPAISAFNEQRQYNVPQYNIPGTMWDALVGFATDCKDGKVNDDNIQEKLNSMVTAIKGLNG